MEKITRRKLTLEQAQLIRELSREGVTIGKLARDFQVSESTISAIRRGNVYREEERPPVIYSGAPDWKPVPGISALADKYDPAKQVVQENQASQLSEGSEKTLFGAESSDEELAEQFGKLRGKLRAAGYKIPE